MSYCTQADLVARYGLAMLVDLTDRGDVATGVVDADVIQAAVDAASSIIDGYLQGLFALPLSEVPPILSDIACAIAIWRLHTGMPGDKIKADYDDARKSLEQVARGLIKLTSAGNPAPSTGTSGAQSVDRERPFTETTMKGFI